jgi:hypothetical protein
VNPSRLQAWIVRSPASAVRLELRWDSLSATQTLCACSREEISPNTADQFLEVAQDHCDSVCARVSFAVVWLDAAERVIGTKPLRCHPSEEEDDDLEPALAGAGRAPKEEATNAGIVAQLMRHVENRERMLNIAIGTNLKLMHDQVREARAAEDALRIELRLVRMKVREAENDNANAVDVESEARAEAITKVADALVQQVIPIAAAHLRGGLQ